MLAPTTSRGFTIIELMLVLTLLAVVAAIAAPNFAGFVERNRAVTQAEALKALLTYARGEAMINGNAIVVKPNNNGQWEALLGNDVLRSLDNDPSQTTIRSDAAKVTFAANGSAVAARFTVCIKDEPSTGYYLTVASTGAITTFKQGVADVAGNPLKACTL